VIVRFISKQWKLLIFGVVVVDLLLVGGLVYMFTLREARRAAAAELARPLATATPTATLWPGPGRRVTATPTLPPTPLATSILAESGFPVGFTPTPQPTRQSQMITLPYVYPAFRNNLNVPVINQIYYPEPFFPAGTNNACGPVALYAALQALGVKIDYPHLRDLAVANGFTSYGISKNGLVGSAAAINREQGNTLTIEQGNRYNTADLMKQVRTGGVAIVLLQVQRVGGKFQVTADTSASMGHFLIVDNINLRTKTVQFAGSTLGMDQVPLGDFLQAWGKTTQPISVTGPLWHTYLKNEPADNWALIIRRKR